MSLKFRSNNSMDDKLAVANTHKEEEQSEVHQKEKESSKVSKVSDLARKRMEAMAQLGLKLATTPVTADVPDDDKFNLDVIASKFKKDIKALALEYILEGVERDIKKIGIFDNKK